MSLSCTASETQRDMAPKSSFLGNRLQNGLPYAIGPLSVGPVCLSVTLVYCGQTVGWIKMKLGTVVGLGLSQIVLDGDLILSVCLVFVLTYFQNFFRIRFVYC